MNITVYGTVKENVLLALFHVNEGKNLLRRTLFSHDATKTDGEQPTSNIKSCQMTFLHVGSVDVLENFAVVVFSSQNLFYRQILCYRQLFFFPFSSFQF